MIPTSKKPEFIKDLHVGHLGEEKTLLGTQECVYWSGIVGDIKEYITGCSICQSTEPSQQKEPLIPHDILSGLCEKVGISIFQFGSHDYLLVAEYFSNFSLIRVLHSTNILKIMFSKHGIATCVFTDQGGQFTSPEFQKYVKYCRFEVFHSTPRNTQSNGFIESMVKVMKQIMSKADQARKDAHLVMLAYRVTPRGPGKLSIAETMTLSNFGLATGDATLICIIKQKQRNNGSETSWILCNLA